MDLWIRSQDKTRLVKITQVKFIDKESDIDDFKNVIRGYGVDGFNFRLGTYKTKERAIEVLDEIEMCTGGIMGFDGVENITTELKNKINELIDEINNLKEK